MIIFGFFVSMSLAVNAQTISEEARRHLIRGQAAVEAAKSSNDYKDAITEFELTSKLAPDWPAPYFNLGMVQGAAGNYDEAIKNLRKYLALSPNAADAAQVRDHIYKLEYLRERSNLEGIWRMDKNEVGVKCDPKSVAVTRRQTFTHSEQWIRDIQLEILKKSGGYETRILSSKSIYGRTMGIPDGPFVTLHREGETVKIFNAEMYTCVQNLASSLCPWDAKFILQQVSANTLKGTIDVTGEAYQALTSEPVGIRCYGKIILRREDNAKY